MAPKSSSQMASRVLLTSSSKSAIRSCFVSSRLLSSVSIFDPTTRLCAARLASLPRGAFPGYFQRAYTSVTRTPSRGSPPAINVSPMPTLRPKRRFPFFRWTWRVTYLSALASAGWLMYAIHDLRNPNDQIEADTSKKTLVVLGQSKYSRFLIC
jgi:hypothetical protein